MEYAERVCLVPQSQLDRVQSTGARGGIQQVVESDLDAAMGGILLRTDLDQREEVELCSGILTRCLAVVELGDRGSGVLTLSLPGPEDDHGVGSDETHAEDGSKDGVTSGVLESVPTERVKGSGYILDKVSGAEDLGSWSESGEFVFGGGAMPGSHMLDLVNSVAAPQQVRGDRGPGGWAEFLRACAELGMPFSTVPGQQVRSEIVGLKGSPVDDDREVLSTGKTTRGGRGNRQGTQLLDGDMFVSPVRDGSRWMHF